MHRLLSLVIFGVLAVGVANADVRPPAGFKRVQLDHKITTEKEYPDWVFFTLVGGPDRGKGGKGVETGRGVMLVKLDPKTPILLSGEGRNGSSRQGSLAAVPKETVKMYETEKELLIAVRDRSAPGLIRGKTSFTRKDDTTTRFGDTNLDSITTTPESDSRKIVVQEMTVESVDPKEGIILKRVKDKEEPKKEAAEEESLEEYSPASHGNNWVAALAGSLAVALSGVWLTRQRTNAKPSTLENR